MSASKGILVLIAMMALTGCGDDVTQQTVDEAVTASQTELGAEIVKLREEASESANALTEAKAEAATAKDERDAALNAALAPITEEAEPIDIGPVEARPENGWLPSGPTLNGTEYISQDRGGDWTMAAGMWHLGDVRCAELYDDGRFETQAGISKCPWVDVTVRGVTAASMVPDSKIEAGADDYIVSATPNEDGIHQAITMACYEGRVAIIPVSEGLYCPDTFEIIYPMGVEKMLVLGSDDVSDAAEELPVAEQSEAAPQMITIYMLDTIIERLQVVEKRLGI